MEEKCVKNCLSSTCLSCAEVRVLDCEANGTGINRVEMMFSPNPGEEMKPYSAWPQAGNISLCAGLKIVLAGVYEVPTLVLMR